jgi:hypothetical protein
MARPTQPLSAEALSADGLSLAHELEQQRLAHRAARIRRALSAMRRIADTRRDEVPAPLRLGITDFGRELTRVEQRLKELRGQPLL